MILLPPYRGGYRHNGCVPQRPPIAIDASAVLETATQAFASELRIRLIGYFASHPGRQADAMRALGVERQLIQNNAVALEEVGILVRDDNRHYTVDRDRVLGLLNALHRATLPT